MLCPEYLKAQAGQEIAQRDMVNRDSAPERC